MTKIIRSKRKAQRRLGCTIWDKDDTAISTRNFPPGQHGVRGHRKPSSNYAKQLMARRKFQLYYNIAEKQLNKYYQKAKRMRGDTSENFVGLLERRLNAIVYRLNFAPTIYSANQLVSHKHILVNGKKVNIKSYLVKAGDVIELTENAKTIPIVIESLNKTRRSVPEYMNLEAKNFSGKFIRVPALAEIPYASIMEPSLVVEYYSK